MDLEELFGQYREARERRLAVGHPAARALATAVCRRLPSPAGGGRKWFVSLVVEAFMPKTHRVLFGEVSSPIADRVTKFGGQPNWVTEPQWPLSRQTGNPMRFICQIKLEGELFPQTTAEMAYLFMTDEEGDAFVDDTYEPDGGENAVILQPGVPAVPTARVTGGPTLYRMTPGRGRERLRPEPCEFAVSLVPDEDPPFVSERERWEMSDADAEQATGELDQNKIGGTPAFVQGDEFPFAGGCRLLLQLDSCSVPFSINFRDAGVAATTDDKTARV